LIGTSGDRREKKRDADPPESASLVVYTGWNNKVNFAEGMREVQSKELMHTITETREEEAATIKNPEVMFRSFVSASSSR
jgi:hypothetical protein